MKKALYFLITLLLLSGCAYSDEMSGEQNGDNMGHSVMQWIIDKLPRSDGITNSRMAKDQMDLIYECIINKDSETLMGTLSPYMQEKVTVEEIEALLSFIDGNVICRSETFGDSSSESVRAGKTTMLTLTGIIRRIETDTGNVYTLTHSSYRIFQGQPDKIGVYCISISNETNRKPGNGYSDSDIVSISPDVAFYE